MALGLGMKVIAADSFIPQVDIKVTFFDGNLLQQQSFLNH
jgi:D-3-phosphoglycerate dehydrogenase